MEAKKDLVTRHDLRHDRHTVSLLTDHLVFSPKYRGKVLLEEVAEVAEEIIRETCKELDIEIIDMAMNVDPVHLFIKKPLLEKAFTEKCFAVRDQFPQLKEWCPDHLWAPSCYQKTFQKSFIKNASQSVGHGWEVVERYISGQKGYEKTDTVPVIDEEKEKLKAHKTWYTSLYNKLFGGKDQK